MYAMLVIRPAASDDFPAIRHVARQTWPVTFGDILSGPQISYMLDMMYSLSSLREQVEQKQHVFLLAEEEGQCLGYISYEHSYLGSTKTKIHKIYVLPATQGKGVGKALIQYVADIARTHGSTQLSLNVNRYNKAVDFYRKMGFELVGQEDIDIGNGFLMQDFILEKNIR